MNREYLSRVKAYEQALQGQYLKGWGLIAFVLLIFFLLFVFYSARYFIFSRPDFLTLVMLPVVLTGRVVMRIEEQHEDKPAAQLAVLRFNLKIWLLVLVIFELVDKLVNAPYDFISPEYWLYIVSTLNVQLLLFALLSRWAFFSRRPYVFLAVAYFPAAVMHDTVRYLSGKLLASWDLGLLILVGVLLRPLFSPSAAKRSA